MRINFNKLHDRCRDAVRALKTVDGGDIGMIQRRQNPGFALKPGESVGIYGDAAGNTLIAT